MPLDKLNNLPQPAADWPSLDPSLLGEARPTPPAFPLHLLPGRWRTWVEASSRLFGSADYLAHCLLGGVACAGGAGIRIEVVSPWREPLLLWQALIGGPSSGKSAAFARVRALLDAVRVREEASREEQKESPDRRAVPSAPSVLVDAGLDWLSSKMSGGGQGVLLWREDLGDWMEEARRRSARLAWLAGWKGAPTMVHGLSQECLAVGLLGAMTPERLASFAREQEGALASCFLYVWPERAAVAPLADSEAEDAPIEALLLKIAAFAGHREDPAVVPFDEGAVRRLEALMPALRQLADECDETGGGGVAAEWIGRGVATIVRLAGVLSLMEWAETDKHWLPVGAAHVEAAHALWSDYYLPQALAVFDRAGAGQGSTAGDRAARRVVRWLKRVKAPEISREDVRREALCQSVDAQGAEEVLARLEGRRGVAGGGGHGADPARPAPAALAGQSAARPGGLANWRN